jgi:hypothetical protein
MSDFGELCPLFNTGVYKELFLGRFTASVYSSATFNFLSSVGDPATAPSSFRFGRTVVVTEVYMRRMGAATTATACLRVGRRTGSGTAVQSLFGTMTFGDDVSTFPDKLGAWQAMGLTLSMTLNTADCLDISATGVATDGSYDVVVQYREK